ncbi:MAG: hypothetical protein IJ955_03720 [Oscillospiraceae bacterium]|nr:hypothetical protein [Oscillospiraceae bacterium]MBR2483299.1 hypothetical protein [Oscillospiraceae bacterium]
MKKERKSWLSVLLVLVLLLMPTLQVSASDNPLNITVNWEAAAVYYDTPCDETETFRMSEEEFYRRKVEMEEDLIIAYSRYLSTLSGEERTALKNAQKAWIDCYYAYIDMLLQVWDSNIKVDFEVYGKERRTNIYRDIVLVMLANRIEDLNSWYEGRFARMESSALAEKQQELIEDKKQLQVDMGLCLYVTTENYRQKMMTAHRAFYRFYDAEQAFLQTVCGGNANILTSEGLLQVQRMSYVTLLHYAGCRFYHIEREE